MALLPHPYSQSLWACLSVVGLSLAPVAVAQAQSIDVSGSLPGAEEGPEGGVVMQATHKEKRVLMPRVGYFRAFSAFGPTPNPATLGDPGDTSNLGRNNATPMGEGRYAQVGQWTAGLEYRQDLKTKSFLALDLHGVYVGEDGYGLRKLPPFQEPKSLGAGATTFLAGIGYGKYVPLGPEDSQRLTWLRLAGKLGYLYGVGVPAWINLEFQQHIMLADDSYLSISIQGMGGFIVPAAVPDFQEQFTRRLWVDQVRPMAGFQIGIARIFPDRVSRFENPAEGAKDKLPF